MITDSYYDQFGLLKKIICPKGKQVKIQYARISQHPRHMHDGCEILYVIKGGIRVRISYETYFLETGDFLLINSYELHSIEDIEQENSNIVAVIQCGRELYTEKEGILIWQAPIYKEGSQIQMQVKNAIRKVIELDIGRTGASVEKIEEKMRDLFVLLKHYYSAEIYDIEQGGKNMFAENDLLIQRLNRILLYMYTHFNGALTLEQIAAEHGVSKYYISHMIKQAFGASFQEMMGKIRAERAELFLLGTDLPAGQVSDQVGFSSYQYFNKYFKTCFQMAPMEYRKRYLQNTIRRMGFEETFLESGDIGCGNILQEPDTIKTRITFELPKGEYQIMVGENIHDVEGEKTISLDGSEVKVLIVRK